MRHSLKEHLGRWLTFQFCTLYVISGFSPQDFDSCATSNHSKFTMLPSLSDY